MFTVRAQRDGLNVIENLPRIHEQALARRR